eukprot:scaffold12794_cov125-Isochrysis_galbana.AAC.5
MTLSRLETRPPPRECGLNIEESWRGGGGSPGAAWASAAAGKARRKQASGMMRCPPPARPPPCPMLAGGVGLARDMGRKDVGEEVAGLSGAGDPCPEGVTKDASRDGVMAIGVGASFENGQANVVAMRVTCAHVLRPARTPVTGMGRPARGRAAGLSTPRYVW